MIRSWPQSTYEDRIPPIEGAVISARDKTALIQLPDKPGYYLVFVYAYDSEGNAATANYPLSNR